MPKITNIRIMQRTNLGSYEHYEFAADAAIHEDENLEHATETVREYVDWYSRKPVRDITRRSHLKTLNDPSSTPEARDLASKWLARYDETEARIKSL